MLTNDDIKSLSGSLLPDAVFEEGTEWPTIRIKPEQWPELARQLKEHGTLKMDFLFCLTCIDWKTHLDMVYHLSSTTHRQNLVVKSTLDTGAPGIGTCSQVWKTALFHEREVYELFGVHFSGHPDLRLLILPEGWEGRNPLRKDFDDPVNMIRL